jgi:hypothetical protein
MGLHRLAVMSLGGLIAGCAAIAFTGSEPALVAQDRPGALTTSLDDQVDLAVTVYNSNIALIRDVRQLSLPSGQVRLDFADVAASVNPATVHFRSLTDPARVSVLEQNYQYDLLDPQRLLSKYVGRDVTLVRSRQENGTTVNEEVRARLLAFNDTPVWQIDGEIVTGLHAEQMRFPEVPENLRSRPTLVWQLENSGPTQHRIETSYLARSMSWNADYVLTVSRDDARADLDGWVTVANTSGATFRNARLQLVAGELHRVREEMLARDLAAVASQAPQERSAAFAQEAFSEYHLYSLERRSTLADKETKQIALLEGEGLPIRKRFVVNGQQIYYRNQQNPGSPIRDSVQVFYAFRNDRASNLGSPMPAGTIRVYQADSKGGVQFAGEDRIGHTPVDETIAIQTGTAFDIICERKQTDYNRLPDRSAEFAYELKLRNHKDTAITVEVNEPIGGDWQMVSSTHRARKTDAWAAQFEVPVAANGESVLRYKVRVKW